MYFKFSRFRTKTVQPLRCLVQPVRTNPSAFGFVLTAVDRLRLFLLFNANETQKPRLRNFDTTLPSPYRYESRSNNRLESVANAHTAADLHVRPVSKTALVSRSWAPRTKLKLHDARRLAMHLIRPRRAQKLLSARPGGAAVSRLESKFLNQRVDSRAPNAL